VSPQSPAIRFEPVRDSTIERWSTPRRFDFLHRLPVAPIADTELLHLSHYCPTVITLEDDGPRVSALLDPTLLQSAPVDKNGRWRPPYAPIALRNLPFWPGAKPADIHFAPELVIETAGAGFALLDASGDPSEQFGTVITWIERLQLGMRRLREAAKLVLAADLLMPLVVTGPGLPQPVATDYFTVSLEKLYALAPIRIAAFTSDRCLALDLVTACVFSRRLLARRVTIQKIDAEVPPIPHSNDRELGLRALDIGLRLDGSPLFSFEDFARLKTARAGDKIHADS
jgi:hypothetical protein